MSRQDREALRCTLSQLNWPEDDRDELTRLAKELFQSHFNTQVALVHFHMDAAEGTHVDDKTYSEALRAIGRLQQVSITLKVTLFAFRTTTRIPAVKSDDEQS